MNTPSSRTCPPESVVEGFAIGDLEDDLAEQISLHLAECDSCVATLESIEQTKDTVLDLLDRLNTPSTCLDEPELNAIISRVGDTTVIASEEDRSSHVQDFGPLDPDPLALDRPVDLGSYRLTEKLGQGGMGAVYKAVHTQLEKTVAIKVLAANRFGDAGSTKRFKREMKAIGRVQHPNVVVAHDGGVFGSEHFLVMEFVDGLDVAALDRLHGGLPVEVACEIVRQAAVGLQHAHDQGLIHRDIKPSNLMLSVSGDVKVLDLGLARIETELSSISGDYQKSPQSEDLTAAGTAMGTIGFMSPEQTLDSRSVNQAADLYSLGATLYKLLAGRLPFPAEEYDTSGKMLVAIATQTPPSIADACAELPPALIQIVDCMLSKQPADRIATAREFAEKLKPFATVSLEGIANAPAGVLPDTISEPSSEILKPAFPQRSKPQRRVLFATLALAIGLFLLATRMFWVRTEFGTLRIEIADEKVESRLATNGISVLDKLNKKVWHLSTAPVQPKRLPTGEYRFDAPADLTITDENGLEINGREFRLLDADGELRIRISLASSQPTKRNDVADLSSAKSITPSNSDQDNLPDAYDRRFARWATDIGGKVFNDNHTNLSIDFDRPGGFYVGKAFLDGVQILQPEDFKRFAKIDLKTLSLVGSSLNSQGLANLLECSGLVELYLGGTDVNSADLASLGRLPRLSTLQISASQVDHDWRFLDSIQTLRTLEITGDVRIDDLTEIAKTTRISAVRLTNTSAVSESERSELGFLNPYLVIQQRESRASNDWKTLNPFVVTNAAEQLAEKGLRLKSHRRPDWTPGQPLQWNEIREVNTPVGVTVDERDFRRLAAIGNCEFGYFQLRNVSSPDALPEFLRGFKLKVVHLLTKDIDDDLILRLADSCKFWELKVDDGCRVTEAGAREFERRNPGRKLVTQFGVFSPATRALKQSDAKDEVAVVRVRSSEAPQLRSDDAFDREFAQWVMQRGGKTFEKLWGSLNEDFERKKPFRVGMVFLPNTEDLGPIDISKMMMLPDLRVIDLSNSSLNADGLRHITENPRIKELRISGTQLNALDLAGLKKMSRLSWLEIDTTQVNGDWTFANGLTSLQNLSIKGDVGRDELLQLAKMPRITALQLVSKQTIDAELIDELNAINPSLVLQQKDTLEEKAWKTYNPEVIFNSASELHADGWKLTLLGKKVWEPDHRLEWDQIKFAESKAGHNVSKLDMKRLSSLGHGGFYNLDLLLEGSGAELPDLLHGFRIDHLSLPSARIDDETLLRIGHRCITWRITLGKNARVTASGIRAFQQRHPTCAVETIFGNFPANHRLPNSTER